MRIVAAPEKTRSSSATTITVTVTSTTSSAASVLLVPFPTFLPGSIKGGHGVMLASTDLRSNYILVTCDLVRIDFTVVVDVEKRKESLGILLHLLNRQAAVMVLVGLFEPVCQRIVFPTVRSERFAHRTNEQPSRTPWSGHRSGRSIGSRTSARNLNNREKQWSKDHR